MVRENISFLDKSSGRCNINFRSGNEVGSYSYDAYGNILSETGYAKGNPISYAGYYYDSETQHYYLQARYYNPENGNFNSLDPHPGDDSEPISQNGYTYTKNNPVMFIDPEGRYWKNAWWNSRPFLSATINAVIFLSAGAIGQGVKVVLKQLSKKQLAKSKETVFFRKFKKSMRARGISNAISSKVVGILTTAVGVASFYKNPGGYIFGKLDARDRFRNNGYFNWY
ncbi:RHS repeat-associated core domain-containing protein [Bacillus sp. F19]|nr:RHS repeat-associated core domain-containing protein [Bacillus sp. F19]